SNAAWVSAVSRPFLIAGRQALQNARGWPKTGRKSLPPGFLVLAPRADDARLGEGHSRRSARQDDAPGCSKPGAPYVSTRADVRRHLLDDLVGDDHRRAPPGLGLVGDQPLLAAGVVPAPPFAELQYSLRPRSRSLDPSVPRHHPGGRRPLGVLRLH